MSPGPAPTKTLRMIRLATPNVAPFNEVWAVDHTGSDLEFGVRHLFGTTVLETPYATCVDVSQVVAELQALPANAGYTFEVKA